MPSNFSFSNSTLLFYSNKIRITILIIMKYKSDHIFSYLELTFSIKFRIFYGLKIRLWPEFHQPCRFTFCDWLCSFLSFSSRPFYLHLPIPTTLIWHFASLVQIHPLSLSLNINFSREGSCSYLPYICHFIDIFGMLTTTGYTASQSTTNDLFQGIFLLLEGMFLEHTDLFILITTVS